MDPNQANNTAPQPVSQTPNVVQQAPQPPQQPQPANPSPQASQPPQPVQQSASAQVPQATPVATQTQQPTAAQTPPPPPPKRKFPIKIVIIVAIVMFIIFAVITILALMSSGGDDEPVDTGDIVFSPSSTPEAGPREHTVEEFPEYQGIEVGENTVSFNKVDESFRIKYRGKIYHEQDTGTFSPREVEPETAEDYKWYGLVETPEDVIGEPELFSFKAPATYRSFVFIMKWDRAEGEVYEMYRFANDQVSKLAEFTKDRIFYVPIIDDFSLGGNFMSINIFRCTECYNEDPEVILYHIPSGETRNIGRVTYFEWGDDDNSYEYKQYIEGTNENDVPLSKNEFFVDSEILF